jgi:glycerol-3-phosphate dehydrogenase
LALRGVSCVVVETGDVNSGASGGNHGLLHSGGRYVSNDTEAASECREEGALIKRLAPQCVEDCGGLFVAVAGDDERFVADYPGWCAAAGIEVCCLEPAEARAMEPCSPQGHRGLRRARRDHRPLRLALETWPTPQPHGLHPAAATRVTGYGRGLRTRGARAHGQNTVSGGGRNHRGRPGRQTPPGPGPGAWRPWPGRAIPMLCSQGTLLVTHERMTRRVVNPLRPPGNGDILVPGGTVSILGTTSGPSTTPMRPGPPWPRPTKTCARPCR